MRVATRHDIPDCKRLLRLYSEELGVRALQTHNEAHVEQLLHEMIAGKGFVLIDAQARGMLAAAVTRNFWNPAIVELQEVCFFVAQQFRDTTIGGRLWLRFNALASEMLASGRVAMVFCSRNHGLRIESYGYKSLHTTMVRECQLK